jgi:hypothetical protein
MLAFGNRLNLDYVTFPWWPEDGCDWIQLEDVEIAKRLVPGKRVFSHVQTDTPFQLYEYGDESFRALPRLQKRVKGDGLLVGDRVEIRSRLGRRRPIIATICDMFWDDYNDRIEYRIRYRDLRSAANYGSEEFERLIPPVLPPAEIEITVPLPADDSADDFVYRILPVENEP